MFSTLPSHTSALHTLREFYETAQKFFQPKGCQRETGVSHRPHSYSRRHAALGSGQRWTSALSLCFWSLKWPWWNLASIVIWIWNVPSPPQATVWTLLSQRVGGCGLDSRGSFRVWDLHRNRSPAAWPRPPCQPCLWPGPCSLLPGCCRVDICYHVLPLPHRAVPATMELTLRKP